MTLTPTEQDALRTFRSTSECWPESGSGTNDEAWVRFALAALLESSRVVRDLRVAPLRGAAVLKEDATPVTRYEQEIEATIRQRLEEFCPGAAFVGEEGGGHIKPEGVSVAVDPVDGTWAFLNRMSTSSVVFAVFRDGLPYLGAVANPATCEIAYALADRPTRLIQLDWIDGGDHAAPLPLDRANPDSVLVNVHPSRKAAPLVARMMDDWQSGRIQMLRMEGGSPAAAMLEVAKGSFVYANLWDKSPAQPFDLAAGVLLVRNAGGRVVDLAGADIDSLSHAGAFIAGLGSDARELVRNAAVSVQ